MKKSKKEIQTERKPKRSPQKKKSSKTDKNDKRLKKIQLSARNNPSFTINKLNDNNNKEFKKQKRNSFIFDEKFLKNEQSFLVLESFLKEYQIKPVSMFILYLSETWRELSFYSQNPCMGVIPFVFSRFFPLPGLINKRLFDILDIDKDGYLSPKEFIEGLSTIFCEEIYTLIKFVFSFYDFDYDGFINSEDIHAIMSYIPVINSFSDMIDIEEEIYDTLEQIFIDNKKQLNLYEFTDLIINKERYEIFIPIISFLYEQKPFTSEQIMFFYKDIYLKNEKKNKKNEDCKNNINIYQIEGRIKLKVKGDKDDILPTEDNFDETNNNINNSSKKVSKIIIENTENTKKSEEDSNKQVNNILANINIEKKEKEIINASPKKNDTCNSLRKIFYQDDLKDITSKKNFPSLNKKIDDRNSCFIKDKDNFDSPKNDSSRLSESEQNDKNPCDSKQSKEFTIIKINNNDQDKKNNNNNTDNEEKGKEKEKKENVKIENDNFYLNRINRNNKNISYHNLKDLEKKNSAFEARFETKIKRNRTKSMKIGKMVNRHLICQSPGFKYLHECVPLLINSNKILAQYSNNEVNKKLPIQNNVIKNLCERKIKNKESHCKITDILKKEREDENSFGSLGDYDGLKYNNEPNKNITNNSIKKKNNYINNDIQNGDSQNIITVQSYLYKITTNSHKIKKLYFKLYNKDLYFYKNENSIVHQGMHNLSNYYFGEFEDDDDEEEDEEKEKEESQKKKNNKNESESLDSKNENIYSNEDIEKQSVKDSSVYVMSNSESDNKKNNIIERNINGVNYYCFILINQKGKTQLYMTPDLDIYNEWIKALKKVLNYKDIYEQYEITDIVGKGKFSTVYCAEDKINNRKVAIKHIKKTSLKFCDLELIKYEIDILKICQHPYVVGIYDIIETYNTIDIIMEYCSGGDLYNYLCKKKFNLTEMEIVSFIHKISKAVYSMHNLGIIHRDLKLSNIAMKDISDGKEDIRILDFGLSKILGPEEFCKESYGTPGYAAPEVINEDEYRFKADVWSIGAIVYFMCSSKLPFDYISKGSTQKNIIMNTLNDKLRFDEPCWKKLSKEAVKFIKDTMNKNIEKRLNIREVLEHEWIKKYFYQEVAKRKESINITYFGENKDFVRRKDYKVSASSSNKAINRLEKSPTPYRLYVDVDGIPKI